MEATMSFKFIRGGAINETAGPMWHLVGQVRRDRSYLNRLILTRKRDVLSPKIKAMNGRWLGSIKLTDPVGKSATLSNALVGVSSAVSSGNRLTPGLSSEHSEHDTNLLEDYSFTFTAIAVENLAGSTSTTDDVWP
jgi:hypothetical protein